MRSNGTIVVDELPLNQIPFRANFSINSNHISNFTHSLFKYPCKFIPHIPRWAIKKYLPKEDGIVLDPFCGSGTTLVEAVLLGKKALGIDCDPFSQLLSKVKSTPLSSKQLNSLKANLYSLFTEIETTKPRRELVPKIPNIGLWFDEEITNEIAKIKTFIQKYYDRTEDDAIRDFLLVTLASVIRKVSKADNLSPKPYVSRRIKKKIPPVLPTFKETFLKNLDRVEEFLKSAKKGRGLIVGTDARVINHKIIRRIAPKGIDLVITSPPYINAFDYVRSLKLENFWVTSTTSEDLSIYRRKQIGTEFILSSEYNALPPETNNKRLNIIVEKIYKHDKRRAHVVYNFFKDMKLNFQSVYSNLKNSGVYCVVIGESKIRGINIPSHEILIDIGQEIGFTLDCLFSYEIKNRYLRIPRQGRGGLIKKDWVFTLKKGK